MDACDVMSHAMFTAFDPARVFTAYADERLLTTLVVVCGTVQQCPPGGHSYSQWIALSRRQRMPPRSSFELFGLCQPGLCGHRGRVALQWLQFTSAILWTALAEVTERNLGQADVRHSRRTECCQDIACCEAEFRAPVLLAMMFWWQIR